MEELPPSQVRALRTAIADSLPGQASRPAPTAKLAGFEKAKLLWEYEGGVPTLMESRPLAEPLVTGFAGEVPVRA